MRSKMRKKVISHLREDIKGYKEESREDRQLIKELRGKKMKKKPKKGLAIMIAIGKPQKKSDKQSMKSRYHEHSGEERALHGYHKTKNPKRSYKRFKKKEEERMESPKQKKFEKVMREYKKGELRSGSKTGPKVKNRKKALAIAFSEAKKAAKKRRK